MNWLLAGIVAWVMLGLEKGLRGALELGSSGIAPSFIFVFATFAALMAPSGTALWTCLVLGLLVDLTHTVDLAAGGSAVIVGPYALGYVLACQLVLTMRGVMMWRNPLALGFLALLASIVCHLVVVAVFAVRELILNEVAWGAAGQLGTRLGSSLYTGALAVVLALVLFPMAGALGLSGPHARRFARRVA
jgi:rod shape-determining protein MreD